MNTKFILSSVLKTSDFLRELRTRENSDVFKSRDEIHLVFTKKSKFSFSFIFLIGHPLKKRGAENEKKTNFLANPNNFGSKMFVAF